LNSNEETLPLPGSNLDSKLIKGTMQSLVF
jgi:hypothetical protein